MTCKIVSGDNHNYIYFYLIIVLFFFENRSIISSLVNNFCYNIHTECALKLFLCVELYTERTLISCTRP